MNCPFNFSNASAYSNTTTGHFSPAYGPSKSFLPIINSSCPIHIVPSSYVSVPTIIVASRPLSRQELDQAVLSAQVPQSHKQSQGMFMQNTSFRPQCHTVISNQERPLPYFPLESRANYNQSHLLKVSLQSYRTTSSQDILNIQKESNLICFQTESSSTPSEKMSYDNKSVYSQQAMKNTTKIITKKSKTPRTVSTMSRRLQNDQQRREQLLIKKSKIIQSASREMMKLLQEERDMDLIKQEEEF